MLKGLVALLLLGNLAFLAWSHGWLDGVVDLRASDREPERMARQLHPESIVVLDIHEVSNAIGAASTQSSAPTRCFEAGPFDDNQWASVQSTVQAALPNVAVTRLDVDNPGTWIVYMGRYAGREAMARKQDELNRRQVAFDEVTDLPALSPGLSLGRFDNRASASEALAAFEQQGVRTARVVETAPALVSHLLRIEKADAGQAVTLAALKLDAAGKGFTPCARTPGG